MVHKTSYFPLKSDIKDKWENATSKPACSYDPRGQQKEQTEFLRDSPQSSTNNNVVIRLFL